MTKSKSTTAKRGVPLSPTKSAPVGGHISHASRAPDAVAPAAPARPAGRRAAAAAAAAARAVAVSAAARSAAAPAVETAAAVAENAAASTGKRRKGRTTTVAEAGAAPGADVAPKRARGSRTSRAHAAARAVAAAARSEPAEEPAPKRRAARRAKPDKPQSEAVEPPGDEQEEVVTAEGELEPAAVEAPGGEEGRERARPAKRTRRPKRPPAPQYTAAMRKPPPPADAGDAVPVLKIVSWNVAGLRAVLRRDPDALSKVVASERPDVVCLQETKLQHKDVAAVEAALGLQGWTCHWSCSTARLGYSGVAVLSRVPSLSVTAGLAGPTGQLLAEHEGEGRVLTLELPELFVVSVYVPNSSGGLRRLPYRVGSWDAALAGHVAGLEARGGKPVVLTGDLNCAHRPIDIHAPRQNLRTAGFTEEERESFGRQLLGGAGLVDTFRALHPGVVAYTYFTYKFNCRAKNKGWRLDYFLASSSLMHDASRAINSSPTAAAAAVATSAEGQPQQHQPDTPEDPYAEVDDPPLSPAPGAAPTILRSCPPPPTPWRVYDSWILQDVYGSDHLPLGLTLVRSGSVDNP